MGELLGEGRPTAEVSLVRTQIELLDRYWQHRMLTGAADAHRRETTLRAIAESMVDRRSARHQRLMVPGSQAQTLADVLSRGVLVDDHDPVQGTAPGDLLSFPHHVLFEYAVERLLFRGPADTLVRRLARHPDLVLENRPSLVLHALHLWEADARRTAFWELAFRFAEEDSAVPVVATVIAPAVAVQQATSVDDFEQLLAPFARTNDARCDIALRLLRHVVAALNADDRRPLVGASAGLWAALLERVSREIDRRMAAAVLKPALAYLLEQPEQVTPEQLADLGLAARRQLRTVQPFVAEDPILVSLAIQAVCRTFTSDLQDSLRLLRDHLAPERVANWGYIELLDMADEIPRLLAEPVLVKDLYQAVAAHRETRKDATTMGAGQILPLISNVAQDYKMVLFRLERHYRTFLNQAPEEAICAMASAVNAYARACRTGSGPASSTFDVAGVKATFEPDYSFVWDTSYSVADSAALKMLGTFAEHLHRTAMDPVARAGLASMIGPFLGEARAGILWRRLLVAGTRDPQTVGLHIEALAWTPVLLHAAETTHEAAQFAAAMFPYLDRAKREAVERAMLAIGANEINRDREPGLLTSRRVLVVLPRNLLVTHEAKQRAFIRRVSLLRGIDLEFHGVALMNLGGVGNISTLQFRELPERLVREETFTYISLDRERGGKHLVELRAYARNGLLTGGFKVWERDFEEANFSIDELASVANLVAATGGIQMALTCEDLKAEQEKTGKPIGDVIERLWRRAYHYGGKGEAWGVALADWTIEHSCPPEIADARADRPILTLINLMRTFKGADFRLSREIQVVNEQGELVELG